MFIKNHKNEFLRLKKKYRNNQIRLHKLKILFRKDKTIQKNMGENNIQNQTSFMIKNKKNNNYFSIQNFELCQSSNIMNTKNKNLILYECRSNKLEILNKKNQNYEISKNNFLIPNISRKLSFEKCHEENLYVLGGSKIKKFEIVNSDELIIPRNKCNGFFKNLKIYNNASFELSKVKNYKNFKKEQSNHFNTEKPNSQSNICLTDSLTMKKLTPLNSMPKTREGLKLFGFFKQSIYLNTLFKKSKWINTTG
jgi:hypothetical protein